MIVNDALPLLLQAEWSITLSMQFFAIVYNAPAYVVPATIVGVLGGLLGQIYMMAQLPIKRYENSILV
jgi:hypothetical protein